MDGDAFYGKYRGIVSDVNDPEQRGRIRAFVPDVFGDEQSGWAEPSFPYAGDDPGFFAVPPDKALVWIEFEGGDPEFAVWTGCRWDPGNAKIKVPAGGQQNPDTIMLICSKGGHKILLNDDSSAQNEGGITLMNSDGSKIVMNSDGIEIDNGQGAKITLKNNKITLNDGALEVA